jgi:FecR protein
MFRRVVNRFSNLSTRAAIVVAFAAIIAASGVAYLLTRGSNAEADTSVQPIAARIDQVDGSVGIARTSAETDQLDWTEATVNTPVSIGDRIYARSGSHASVALTGHDSIRLNPEASIDVLGLADRRTQLALRSGSAVFEVGALNSDELYEVATPCGAVDFAQPGLYQVGLDGDNAVLSVLNGEARVIGSDGSSDVAKGQVFTLSCATPDQAAVAPIAPDLAGEIVDGYYRDRYARVYDGRYRSYDAYLADPFFYDPYRASLSCQYVSADIPGLYDLDYYGDWVDLSDYGYCWAPRVSAGWAPFHAGYWDWDDLWGPTWIASESWGWAPYHYGRWAFISDRWFWVPEVRTRFVYSPAPVAFFSIGEQVAWVPLGPREVYVPRYYDSSLRPRFLASTDVINIATRQRTFVNFNAPGAVTVVGVNALRGSIGPGRFSNGDPNVIAGSRVVLDPLSINGVRQLAARHEDGRARIKLARDEQQVFARPVVANTKLAAAPGRQDFARALNVQAVSDKGKGSKLKINQSNEAVAARRADGLPQPGLSSAERERQMSALATRAEQGDKSARREMRQMMRDEQRTGQQPAAQSSTGQPPQTTTSRQEMKQQRKLERQQQGATAAQQQATRQAQQQQMKQQRQVERQQVQQQMKQQRQIERQQVQQQMKQQRQVERQQVQQQMKQQRQVERPQQQARPQPKPPKQRPPDAQFQQQRQAMIQQQQAQRQSMIQQQHAARAQQTQRQAIIQQQQAPRAQQSQRPAMIQQQQAARAQQAQRQAVQSQTRQAPQFAGPPIRQNQPQRNVENPRRKPPQ